MEIGATNQSEKTLKIVFLRIGIYIFKIILWQMLKKYNRSRLNSQCDHLTTL